MTDRVRADEVSAQPRQRLAPWRDEHGSRSSDGGHRAANDFDGSARPLRVVVYSLNFAPEPTGVGKYSGELVDELVARGAEVSVVTAPPFYPQWKIQPGFRNRYGHERSHPRLRVQRCPLHVPRRPSGTARLLHHATFVLASMPAMARLVAWRPDVVWVVAPSLMCAPSALTVARLAGAKAWLHVQDYEVDAAFGLGLIKSRIARRIALAVECWILRRFDVVSSISAKMLALARTKGVDPERLASLPNWVDMGAFAGDDELARYRAALGIAPGSKVCLYSGNMGQKQGLELLAEVARCLERRTDLTFVLCGEGSGRDALIERCRGLRNVKFIPLQPAGQVAAFLRCADIHLLPQRADVSDLVMPSKLGGMLASARPVVTTAPRNSELAAVASVCGLLVAPGDVHAFAQAIETLADDPVLRGQLGEAGHRYAREHFDRRRVMETFFDSLCALRGA